MGVDLSCLEEFYCRIENNRMDILGYSESLRHENMELRGVRNAMVSFLEENVKDEGVYVDLFSGDAVVPLALLHLSKEFSDCKKIGKIYAVDNGSDGSFGLIMKNAEFFGLEKKLVPVKRDVLDPTLFFDEPVDSSFLTHASFYIFDDKYIKDPAVFFMNLGRLSGTVLASQAGQDFDEKFVKGLDDYFVDGKRSRINTLDGVVYTLVSTRRSLPD